MGEESTGEESIGEESIGEESIGEEPMGEELMGEEPIGEKPMGEGPLIMGDVRLEKARAIDSGVILGYPTGREIADRTLHIGPGARIRSGSVIYGGSRIGSDLETGHGVVIREENRLGDGLRIWSNSTIDYGCRIGNGVRIHCNCYVAQFTVIEDDVFLAPGVMIANDPHPICMACLKGPTIKRGARIGINATLLPGVVIGEEALIGAGSVVTKDVPARAVVYGNPARVQGSVDDIVCPVRGKAYPRDNGMAPG
jgi:acetyltransferase-like isoleucine patch superfamily enzyme